MLKSQMDGRLFCPTVATESNGDKWPYVMTNNVYNNYSSDNDVNKHNDFSLLSQNVKNCTNQGNAHTIGVNLRVTGQCSQGGRKYMEDFFTVAYQQSEGSNDLEYAFIGIYDGHGGAEAAIFAKEHLMLEIINQKLFWSDSDQDVLRAIREGYIATHYAMWRQQDKWPKTGNGLPSTAGTTATVAFIRREKLFIGHVGDSGIVLGYQNENENYWRAKQLTVDHKPESAEERTRILKSGGKVIIKSGVPRVVWNRPRNVNHRGPILRKTPVDEIPFLAVARSLGDLWSYNSESNEFVVSPDPDVIVIPIDPHTFRCLIFGTDGLWNVVSPQEAVNSVRQNELVNNSLQLQCGINPNSMYWTNPSKVLVDHALQTWSSKKMRADNTSVVTVMLYPPGKAEHNTINNVSKEKCNISTLKNVNYQNECSKADIEVPIYTDDSGTTYKELAMKYLPPEEYRNFDYYENEMNANKNFHMSIDTVSDEDYNRVINNFDWDIVSVANTANEKNFSCESLQVTNFTDYNKCIQVDEPSFGDSYNSLLHCEQMQHTLTDAIDCNISWITSNSTILDSLSDRFNLKSANYHTKMEITNQTDMQDIIKEQMLYQQQCMSQEDGYSLTKLETRREQEAVKVSNMNIPNNIKVVQDQVIQRYKVDVHLNNDSMVHPLVEQSVQMIDTETLYYQQYVTTTQNDQQVKPLELYSLLQQEHEEEKQVAFERQQMHNEVTSTDLMNDQDIDICNSYQGPVSLIEQKLVGTSIEDEKEQLIEEYLQDEDVSKQITHNVVVKDIIEEQKLYDVNVQIHEITSSSSHSRNSIRGPTIESIGSKRNNTATMNLRKIFRSLPSDHVSPRMSLPPRTARPTSFVNTRPTNSRHNSNLYHPVSSSTNIIKNTTNRSTNYTRSRTRSHFYRNISNENHQGDSKGSTKHNFINSPSSKSRKHPNSITSNCSKVQSIHRIKIGHTNKSSSNIQPNHTIKRQLRSNSTNYVSNNSSRVTRYKSTLKSRNSLTKDIKTKTNLTNLAAIIFPNNITPRKYLRNIETKIKTNGDAFPHGELKRNTNFEPIKTSLNRVSKVSKNQPLSGTKLKLKLNNTPTKKLNLEQHPIYTINLRSRPLSSSHLHNGTTKSTCHTSHTKSATQQLRRSRSSPVAVKVNTTRNISLNERPIRMHTRSSSKLEPMGTASTSIPIVVGTFGKSIRAQNTNNSLSLPPPSPKLMRTIGAVAAATRARSLLSAKQATTSNDPQTVVSAVFGKRPSLRSYSNTCRTQLSSNSTQTSDVVSSSISKTACNNKLLIQPTPQTLKGRIIKRLKR